MRIASLDAEHLLKKGGIDSTSEVFAALIAAVLYTSESYFSDHSDTGKVLLTYENNSTFVSHYCSVSCVGSHVVSGPPTHPQSLNDALLTFTFVLLLRMSFMAMERAMLRREHSKFKSIKEQEDGIALAARNDNPLHVDSSSAKKAAVANAVMGVLDVSGGKGR